MVNATWQLVRSKLIQLGFARVLERVGLLGLHGTRQYLAQRYIFGSGLEIGAQHYPLPLPAGVQVTYVDKRNVDDTLREIPDVRESPIVKPNLIEDGFALASIPESSQDFVIGNHVLEHSPNPYGALENWYRVLRPGGRIFISVPIGERCFDRGRTCTSSTHFLSDYLLQKDGRTTELADRDFEHYIEYLSISLPNLISTKPCHANVIDAVSVQQQAVAFMKEGADIHFHVYSPKSFNEFLHLFCERVCTQARVLHVSRSRIECLAVLGKLVT